MQLFFLALVADDARSCQLDLMVIFYLPSKMLTLSTYHVGELFETRAVKFVFSEERNSRGSLMTVDWNPRVVQARSLKYNAECATGTGEGKYVQKESVQYHCYEFPILNDLPNSINYCCCGVQ